MQITYVGPFDAVELVDGTIAKHGETISVSAEVAGRPADPRLTDALAALSAAIEAIDHAGAASLRAEIGGLDHGSGLLAQPSNWVPAETKAAAKKDEVTS
jgi:hypothetical protein